MDLFGNESIRVASDGPQIARSNRVKFIKSPNWANGSLLCVKNMFDGTGHESCFFREADRYKQITENYYSEHYPRQNCRAAGDEGCERSVTYVSDVDFRAYISSLNKKGMRDNFEDFIDISLFVFALASPILYFIFGSLKAKRSAK